MIGVSLEVMEATRDSDHRHLRSGSKSLSCKDKSAEEGTGSPPVIFCHA